MDVPGGTRLRNALAAVVVAVLTASCADAKLNAIAPGNAGAEPFRMPNRLDLEIGPITVHLDPTVMLWGREAKLDLGAIVRHAERRIEGRLHGSPTVVSISAGSFFAIPDVGIGGYTDPYTGRIQISMDSRSPVPLRKMLTIWLPITMAHELHHARRILDGPGYGTTLLDALVAEGSAEAFVREVYTSAPAIPWVAPLARKQEADTWRKALPQLHSVDDATLHERWFFGKDGLPRWAGYRIGYRIVTAYLHRHPHATAAALAMRPSADIYRGSAYDPRG
jgi:hypothetical protein